MTSEVQTIVESLGLQNVRIQVGRERIYPPRDGLEISAHAVEQLKQALSHPEAVKASVKITEGDWTVFWLSKGTLTVPLDPQIQTQLQQAQDYSSTSTTASDTAQESAMNTTIPTASVQDRTELETTMPNERVEPLQEQVQAQEEVAPETRIASMRGEAEPAQSQGQPRSQEADSVATSAARDFDFSSEARNHVAPLPEVANTVQALKDNLELAQQNLKIFAKTVKHRGLKTWVKGQLPILKQTLIQVAQDNGMRLRDWTKTQTPIVKAAVTQSAQALGRQVGDMAEVAGAYGVAYASVIGQNLADKGKALGAKAAEKFEQATQLVDPVQLEPALRELIAIYGKDGTFSGAELNYQLTPSGVAVHLKDGTPVYTNGKFNPQVDTRHAARLNSVAQRLSDLNNLILDPQKSTAKTQSSHAKHKGGFGR